MLRSAAPQSRRGLDPASASFALQAFYEAYFSNYIEGTTFTVDEARSIVFEGRPIPNRAADSHDVLGTYQLVSDPEEMTRLASNPDQFLELLLARHTTVMCGHPDIAGAFKTKPNQAGQTLFVSPELVAGTLAEGWRRLEQLDTAWERAVYTMFLVPGVHPFTDGNGRVARVMMNAELVTGKQTKSIVPTGYRSEYLASRLNRRSAPMRGSPKVRRLGPAADARHRPVRIRTKAGPIIERFRGPVCARRARCQRLSKAATPLSQRVTRPILCQVTTFAVRHPSMFSCRRSRSA